MSNLSIQLCTSSELDKYKYSTESLFVYDKTC